VGVASALGTGALDTLGASVHPHASSERPNPITSFDASPYGAPKVLEVPDFAPAAILGDKGLRTLDRLTKLLLVAARLALVDAGLKREGAWTALSPEQVGVVCSNAYGSLEAITELDRVLVLEDPRYINPAKFPNTVSNSASGYISIWEELRALNVTVSDGNCGGLDAFSCADLFLDSGRAEAILTGGGEAMSEALFLAFDKLGALSHGSCVGEGASFMVVEPLERAEARSARVLATAEGYGTAFAAPPEGHPSLLFTSHRAIERSMQAALRDAGIAPESIDLVVSNASGVELFDREERAAIDAVFGPTMPIAAPKQNFGETLGASAALAVAASLAWLGGVKPTCLVRGDLSRDVRTVLVSSVGYYGNASALVLAARSV
jgi:3-oxoacyl-[acyl-carrier-protein] synthase II